MKNKINIYSWPVIIIALICFWPVGLFLILKKMSIDKTAAMLSSKLIKGFGIASCCFAAIGLLVSIGDGFDGTDAGMVIFFAAAGGALLYLANKIKKDAASVKQYISIIVNGGERQLDAISVAVGKGYEAVKTDVQKMIDKGFLKNAYINENTREVVLNTKVAAVNAASEGEQVGNVSSVQVETKVVACPCCGANNTIVGNIGECEYCGSPLK